MICQKLKNLKLISKKNYSSQLPVLRRLLSHFLSNLFKYHILLYNVYHQTPCLSNMLSKTIYKCAWKAYISS